MTADEIKLLGDSEMETGRSVAIALGIVSIAFLVIAGAFTLAVVPNLLVWVFVLTVGFGAAAATGVLFAAWRRRNTIIAQFLSYVFPAPEPARPAPALPEATKPTFKLVGEGRTLHGFDQATLMYMCDYLANGNPWTEAKLENMPVPHLFPTAKFGKAQEGTPYQRLFGSERGLFIRAGIIEGRGGDGNRPGKLAIASPITMMQLLKELQDAPDL